MSDRITYKSSVNSAELSSGSSDNGVCAVEFMSWAEFKNLKVDSSALDCLDLSKDERRKIDLRSKSRSYYNSVKRIFDSVFNK